MGWQRILAIGGLAFLGLGGTGFLVWQATQDENASTAVKAWDPGVDPLPERRPPAGGTAPRPPAVPAEEPQKDPEEEVPAAKPAEEPEPVPLAVEPEDDAPEAARLVLELRRPVTEEEMRVRIQVRDSAGNAVPDVLVVVREAGEILFRDRSNENGRVTFAPYQTEVGPFQVDAVAPGYETKTAPSVAPGATVTLTLALRPSLRGVLKAPSLERGKVRLFTQTRTYVQDVDEKGEFLFEDLEEGEVVVQGEAPPYGSKRLSILLRKDEQAYVRLRIRKRDRILIIGEISGWPTGSRRGGTVKINGIPAEVKPNGIFRFGQAVVGVNEVLIDAPGRALLRERFTVTTGGNNIVRRKFKLKREATVRGRVRGRRHGTVEPIQGAEVRIGVNFGDPHNSRAPLFPIEAVPLVRTDRDGRFEIGRLDPRLQYVLHVVAQGYGGELREVLPTRGNSQRITLPSGPFIFGRVRGFGGVPREAVITAERAYEDEGRLNTRFNIPNWDTARGTRQSDGTYSLSGLLPGSYLVRGEAAEFGSVEAVVDVGAGSRLRLDVRLKKGDFGDDDAELLKRLPPPVQEPDEDEGRRGAYTEVVVDMTRPADELPFPAIRVELFYGDQEWDAPREYNLAEFILAGLPEGTWRAVLTHKSLKRPRVWEGLELRLGETTTIRYRDER